MLLLVDQKTIIARPGESVKVVVYLLNDDDDAATSGYYALRVRAQSEGVPRDGWYDPPTISPRAEFIPAWSGNPRPYPRSRFEVEIRPRWSPGTSGIIEFRIEARKTTASGAATDTPGTQTTATGALSAALDVALTAEPSGPPFAAAATTPMSPLTREPERGMVSIYEEEPPVDLEEQSAPATDAVGTPPGGSSPVVAEGTVYLVVPPIPPFELEILPYRPGTETASHPIAKRGVSGWRYGQFAIRVVNQAPFRSGFRLKVSPDAEADGPTKYELEREFLHIAEEGSDNTVLTVRPPGKWWLRRRHHYGFKVEATPLVADLGADETSTKTQPGTFLQRCTWFDPLTLLALPLLLPVWYLVGTPRPEATPLTTLVFQDDFDLDSHRNVGKLEDLNAAREAMRRLKIGKNRRVRLEVGGNRPDRVSAEINQNRQDENAWKPIHADLTFVNGRNWEVALPDSIPGGGEVRLRLGARGWSLREGWSEWRTVTLAPRAVNQLELDYPSPMSVSSITYEGRQIRGIKQRIHSIGTGNHFFDVRFTNTNQDEFRCWEPRGKITIGVDHPGAPRDSQGEKWIYEYHKKSGGRHESIVTVFTHARNGYVHQFRILGD